MSATRLRDLPAERDLTKVAGTGLDQYWVDVLIQHAELRASELASEYVTDPLEVLLGRDRPVEACEELLDARNHLVWWLEANPDHHLYSRRLQALRLTIEAFILIQET